jgi:hypothetical protein
MLVFFYKTIFILLISVNIQLSEEINEYILLETKCLIIIMI